MFDDFDRYMRTPDAYVAPDVKEFLPTVSTRCTAPALQYF